MAPSNSSTVPNDGGTPISCRRYGGSPPKLIFTHGAGGTLDSPAMVHFATGFNATGASTGNGIDDTTSSSLVCFQGPSNLAARTRMFAAVWRAEQTASAAKKKPKEKKRGEEIMALGGRSMGARAAVVAATAEAEASGVASVLVLVSYPLRAGGGGKNGGAMRDGILRALPAGADVLFVSGDGDNMCDLAELDDIRAKMSSRTWLVTVRNADHGMNVKPKKGTQIVGEEIGRLVAEWLHERDESATECEVFFEVDGALAARSGWGQKKPHGMGQKSASASKAAAKEEPKKDSKKSKEEVGKAESKKGAAKGTKRRLEDTELPSSQSRQLTRRKKTS